MRAAFFNRSFIVLSVLSIFLLSPTFADRFATAKGIDTAVEWDNGKAYFFKGGQYIRFDMKADRVDPGYPKPIELWKVQGLPWTEGIDAAVNWGDGKVYFFKGSQYVRFDIKADRVDPGYPMPLASWKLPWSDGIDAAVNWGNGKAYLFKGSQYVRFDIKADRVDPGYPMPLASWKLPWSDGIDAAVNWGNGKAYLFKGGQYVRFDISADRVDPGYPKPIDLWPGLSDLMR